MSATQCCAGSQSIGHIGLLVRDCTVLRDSLCRGSEQFKQTGDISII